MTLVLHGYHHSVYLRIARLALAEKGLAYERVEVNPFSPEIPAAYLALHPFGRVPTLVHGDPVSGEFVLYETGAITRYVDRAFAGPQLQPDAPRALARMDQIIAVVDSYAYWPMVRQVFSHGVFRPAVGQEGDREEVERGLVGSAKALRALEVLASANAFLVGPAISLADFHLGAMMAYFTAAPEGDRLLADHPRLAAWWHGVRHRPSFADTDPGPPG